MISIKVINELFDIFHFLFYTHSTSRFRLAAFPTCDCDMWLVDPVLGSTALEGQPSVCLSVNLVICRRC